MSRSFLPRPSVPDRISADLDQSDVQRWSPAVVERHNSWSLADHDPWTDHGVSRVVLLRKPFMVCFYYPTGDAAQKTAAWERARAYAESTTLHTVIHGDIRLHYLPEMVLFDTVDLRFGVVRLPAANELLTLIQAGDTASIRSLLNGLGRFFTDECTEEVARRLTKMSQPIPVKTEISHA